MAVQLSREQVAEESTQSAHSDFSELLQASDGPSELPHAYELKQSETLSFLHNLLYDDKSSLTNTDILNILNYIKERESTLKFSNPQPDVSANVQGVTWGPSIRRKFYQERLRIGSGSWFTNVPNSRAEALKDLSILSYEVKTDFFTRKNFYGRLKNHITHFQLRSLVVCGDNQANGIFYPSAYSHDDNLQSVVPDMIELDPADYHTFFKIIRMMPDETTCTNSKKLDCILDSSQLQRNANSRVSSLACSDKLLATGTFEGGMILHSIEDALHPTFLGEFSISKSTDGITNHITIEKNDSTVLVASNDFKLRQLDIEKSMQRRSVHLPFAINCLSVNPHNPNEYFIAADSTDNFILDRRCFKDNHFTTSARFSGHKDYGFSCDWSPADENLLVSGNQDGTVRLWDRRRSNESVFVWNSALGSHAFDIDGGVLGGPVRNCKFGHYGEHIVWAESLDHVGIVPVNDLKKSSESLTPRVQSIDFIGKCIGLNLGPTGNGRDENLIIGVNDCPLGGILSYHLDAPDKPLPFDFTF